MGPSEAARRVGTSADTVKRWLKDYEPFFTPSANPEGQRPRQLEPHDLAVLALIKNLRDVGLLHEDIRRRLEEVRANNYADLPPGPVDSGESIPTEIAAARASSMVENALLERELELTRDQLKVARMELEAARAELAAANETEASQGERIHGLELELERARGKVAELEARLSGYALSGDRAASPAVLLLLALAVGAVLMLAAFIVISLAG